MTSLKIFIIKSLLFLGQRTFIGRGKLRLLIIKIIEIIIFRGLRVASDFEYEFQLAGMNNKLNKNLETVFLMAEIENQIISSNFVKEIAALKGDLVQFVPNIVIKALKTKFK